MPEDIVVNIAADGSLSYVVKGVKGKGCKDLTRFIDTLGTVTESKATHEMCEMPQKQKLQQGRG